MRKLFAVIVLALSSAACGDPTATRVAFGDSVTFGYGGRPGGWVTHLSQMRGETITNYGLPTELVRNGKDRFAGPIGPLALSPLDQDVLLLHGGNDIAGIFLGAACHRDCEPESAAGRIDEVVADVAKIIDVARDNNRNVTMATYWRVNAAACEGTTPNLKAEQTARANLFIDAYNAKLLVMAYDRRVPVVRLDQIGLESDPRNFYDCIHPSDGGYAQIAAKWAAVLDP
jgi:lysophospholipase L1-like esterase